MKSRQDIQKALNYFDKWRLNKFPLMRVYWLSLLACILASFVIWVCEANITNERFKISYVLRSVAVASPAVCFVIFVVRFARIRASWIVVRKALAISRTQGKESALMFLSRTYKDIHPTIIAKPEFQWLIDMILAKDTVAARPIASDKFGDNIESNANLALQWTMTIMALIAIISIIRMIFLFVK